MMGKYFTMKSCGERKWGWSTAVAKKSSETKAHGGWSSSNDQLPQNKQTDERKYGNDHVYHRVTWKDWFKVNSEVNVTNWPLPPWNTSQNFRWRSKARCRNQANELPCFGAYQFICTRMRNSIIPVIPHSERFNRIPLSNKVTNSLFTPYNNDSLQCPYGLNHQKQQHYHTRSLVIVHTRTRTSIVSAGVSDVTA